MNYPQFIDLRVNGVLVSTQLVTLEFTANGEIVNNNEVIFPITSRVKGKASIHVLGTPLKLSIEDLDLVRGDTVTLRERQIAIELHQEMP